eukprot:scaffold90767_cov78-Phaeocystis_antarctica.AAC.4
MAAGSAFCRAGRLIHSWKSSILVVRSERVSQYSSCIAPPRGAEAVGSVAFWAGTRAPPRPLSVAAKAL